MENKPAKIKSGGNQMSKEDLGKIEELADKSLTIALNSTAEEYYIFYKGQNNVTFKETIMMWGHFTDWVVSRARELDIQIPNMGDDVSCGTHTIRAFAKKVVDLGQEQAELEDGLQLNKE